MPRPVIRLAVLVAVAYLGICVLMFVFQRALVYYPQPRSGTGEVMALESDGLQLVVSVYAREHGSALLYFGGNAEDVSRSIPQLAEGFPQHALYLMHYRGYGGSEGRPTEAGLITDALALYDAVASQHDAMTIVGRSLGSGVAMPLAAARPVTELILVTPFDSLVAVARRHYPFLPVRWLMRDRYEAWHHASAIEAPTRLIVAERDEIIPRQSSEALHAAFPAGVASLHIVPGAGHNTVSSWPDHLDRRP
jgi:pimeloyl-ACP methyl ester carboxylesterase